MKEKLNTIKELIKEGKLDTAIEQLNAYIQSDTTQDDEPYYLLEMPTANKAIGKWRSTTIWKQWNEIRKVQPLMHIR